MTARSYFYDTIYSEFKRQNYLGALQNAEQYRTTQTFTRFRRIYNYLSKVLEDIGRGKPEDMQKYKRVLSQLIIQVQYQKANGVLASDLANGIMIALRDILGSLDRNIEESKASARALREALDAVLAFAITE